MKIYSVSDPEFRPYGKVLTGYDTSALVAAMQTVPMPERGTAYEPAIEALETCGIFDAMQNQMCIRDRRTPDGGNAERQRTGGQQQEKRRQQIPTFHA